MITPFLRGTRTGSLTYALYLLPVLVILLIVFVYPLVFAGTVSFQKWDIKAIRDGGQWIGLDNYKELLTHHAFWSSVRATLKFLVFAIAGEVILGMALALLLNREFGGKRLVRTAFMTPLMMGALAVGILWLTIYNPQYGLLNTFVRMLGGEGVVWLGKPSSAIFFIAVVDIWHTTPFVMLLLLAGMQGIPAEQYEAAAVDGAGAWQSFRFITLPNLMTVILITVTIRTMDAIRVFDKVYILTKGGPAGSTEVLSMFIHQYGFGLFRIGFTGAACVVFLIIILLVCYPYIRLLLGPDREANQ